MRSSISKTSITIPLPLLKLNGDLSLPENATSLVIFAHGSGSSRLSPRNQQVANYLNDHGMGTFLFDLLTHDEDQNYSKRFDIELLAYRLEEVTKWFQSENDYKDLRIGFFGASTGAAAALSAARDLDISAIVSRGGRPDLAKADLPFVKAPTLLIVGDKDIEVLSLNREALALLHCEKKLELIEGATHLFEESGAMEKVCLLAANWFELHFQSLALDR